VPLADNRYGVTLHTQASGDVQTILSTLGVTWYHDFGRSLEGIPPGKKKVIAIPGLPGPSAAEIQAIVSHPSGAGVGAVWYILGEPNKEPAYADPVPIVGQLRDLYTAIKAADPTALITSPAVLNWSFTCNGCGAYAAPALPAACQSTGTPASTSGGYLAGCVWMHQFLTAYQAAYGQSPPIDIWAIDVYPLDFTSVPTASSGHAATALVQLVNMRSYMNANGYAAKPIWIMELSLHWGWDQVAGQLLAQHFINGLWTPCGTYRTDMIIDYFRSVYNFLESNPGLNVQRWFSFQTYQDVSTPNASATNGVSIFTTQSPSSSLTPFGQYFVNRAHGQDVIPTLPPNPTLPCP
jgi:hypothetical protein